MRLCLLLVFGFAVLLVGCAEPEVVLSDPIEARILDNGEPSEITVQHCLIGFSGSVPGKTIRRSSDAAGKLAADLLEKAKAGENFDEIISAYTNDSRPGIYQMTNSGVSTDGRDGVYSRDKMVPAFGNVGFALEVGEYGMSEHDQTDSPFGWHIIKRLR